MVTIPIEFVFSEEERQLAMKEGHRRQAVNEAKGLRGRNRGPWQGDKALQVHLLGAAGEVAVASYLGLKDSLFLEKEAKRGSADLPGNIDVKTRSKHSYDLIVQKNESLEKKFVLVTIEHRQTLLWGWLYGEECMKDEFWADPARGRPAYFVRQSFLRPMETLK